MNLLVRIKKNLSLSKVTLLVIAVILIWSFFNIKIWTKSDGRRQVISNDITNYYCYLPAAFIHKDLTFRFVEKDWERYTGESMYWPVPVEGSDKYVIKMSMGLSYMYAPFFGIAHAYASVSNDYEADGFSTPYEVRLVVSSICWIILGFVFLRLVLLKHFSEVIASLVMLIILLGTNFYYYGTTEPAMSHAYSFALIAIFLYYSIQWLDVQKVKYVLFVGLLGGAITLIRPTNILIFLFPFLYGVVSIQSFKERLQLLKVNWKHILIIFVSAFIVFLPQLLFWKYNSGYWVYYSYTDEHFFFGNSHVFYGVLSYRKGWLVYTPVMIFAIIGLLMSIKEKLPFTWSIIIFLPLFLYVVFSWWCWWYGGGFGSRPMIDVYALMALPLGAFLQWLGKLKWYWSSFPIVLILLCVFLNLEDSGGFWDNINDPDYDKAKKGIEEYNTMSSHINHLRHRGLISP
jgi:hypothetical protein